MQVFNFHFQFPLFYDRKVAVSKMLKDCKTKSLIAADKESLPNLLVRGFDILASRFFLLRLSPRTIFMDNIWKRIFMDNIWKRMCKTELGDGTEGIQTLKPGENSIRNLYLCNFCNFLIFNVKWGCFCYFFCLRKFFKEKRKKLEIAIVGSLNQPLTASTRLKVSGSVMQTSIKKLQIAKKKKKS